jgi:NAD(P)H-hydrate epimerase
VEPLLSAAEMKQADREAIESFYLPEIILMEHAAVAVAEAVEARFGRLLPQTRGVVVAGAGNNGGDALAAARILHEKGCTQISVALLDHGRPLTESSARMLKILGRMGVAWGHELATELLTACDWVIDGVLGTGLTRDVESPVRETLQAMNLVAGKKWIVSIDIPSGLCADTGNPRGLAVKASQTVTLGFYKRGLFTGEAADYVGEVTLSAIQIPRAVSSAGWGCFLYCEEDARRLPRRANASNKGSFGHVGIVAGPESHQGAAALSAVGALRAGAGLVTVGAQPATLDTLRPRLPREIMTEAFGEAFLTSRKYQALVLGPGMGVSEETWLHVQSALGGETPLVLDADALTVLAAHAAEARKLLAGRRGRGAATVLTPHPKEAGRLLGTSVDDIQRDRFAALDRLIQQWDAVILLKGKGTLVGSADMPKLIVDRGDSGLAKGGTGDILAGIIGSFLAQGVKASQAVPLSAYLHGRASERLSQIYGQQRSSFASEIADQIPWVLGDLERQCPKES